MGYNQVVFLLKDLTREIERSPKTAVHLLMYGDTYNSNKARHQLAESFGEPTLHEQAMEVLPAFHANMTQYYMAGGNSIETLEQVGTRMVKGKKCVVLQLPDYLQEK